jgi:hypothetical protein
MQLTPYHLSFPEQAATETRSITIQQVQKGIDPGEYVFLEFFCDDATCDCRRALIGVYDANHQLMANISYGWEKLKFYEKWMGSRVGIEHIPGVNLYEMQPQGKGCKNFVAFFKEMIARDPAYEKRIRQHYQQMKQHSQPEFPIEVTEKEKIGRNDPCLCGGGKKAKKCCL